MDPENTKFNTNPQYSILSAIQPLIYILQVTGFAIFTVNPTTWKADIKIFNIFSGIVTIIINVCLHYLFWISFFDFDIQGTEIVRTALPKLVYSCVFIYFLGKIFSFFNRQKIVKFLQKFCELDEKFKELDIHFDYKSDRARITHTLILVCGSIPTISIIAFCIHLRHPVNIDLSMSIFIFFGNTSQFLITYQIIITMIGVRRRHAAVNNFLTSKFDQKISEFQILSEIQFLIVEILEIFNSIYGPVNMMCVALVFGWHCFSTFLIVMMSSVMWMNFTWVCIIHVLMHFVMFSSTVVVIYYCESAKDEGRKTVKVLYKNLSMADCGLIRERIRSLISQILDTKVEFSCGLVDFNWKFLFQFLTAAIMYFVILIQFEASFDKAKN
ncbi:hypothetical protein ACKWTF_014464 [Chironomus riparius]